MDGHGWVRHFLEGYGIGSGGVDALPAEPSGSGQAGPGPRAWVIKRPGSWKYRAHPVRSNTTSPGGFRRGRPSPNGQGDFEVLGQGPPGGQVQQHAAAQHGRDGVDGMAGEPRLRLAPAAASPP